MKIVILGTAHPLRGGLSAYNERIAYEFQSQGHVVVIYTFSLQYPDFLFPGTTQFSDQPAPKDLNIKVAVNSVNPFNWWKVGREIKALNADLLIVKFWLPFMAPCLGTICKLVRSNNKTKVISIIDNIIPHEKRIGDFQFAKYFVNNVDGFIAQSKSVLNDLNLFDATKPKRFSPHPLYDNFGAAIPKEEAKAKLGLDSNKHYLLFFGFIRDYKGLDILLKAISDKRFKDQNINVIVAGEFYNNAEQYHQLIEELKIADLVTLRTDFIPDDMVRYYFCASDIVVQPYKHATQSGVTQICYHFNRPMIVTNVGGLPEIVPNDVVGFVVEPEPTLIADAILKFYAEQKGEIFASNINIEKEKYSWNAMLKSIYEVAGL
ncbi:MAG: glycosyltransferase [Chitinophagales bacterium]|nr:glycosyltransferase [Chitinophagales bacterium]